MKTVLGLVFASLVNVVQHSTPAPFASKLDINKRFLDLVNSNLVVNGDLIIGSGNKNGNIYGYPYIINSGNSGTSGGSSGGNSNPYHNSSTSGSSGGECGGGWVELYRGCYLVVKSKKSWISAQSYCSSQSGILMEPSTPSKQAVLQQLIHEYNLRMIWLGGMKRSSHWYWVSGRSFSMQQWGEGEPNNKNQNEDCLESGYWYNGKWNDQSCSDNLEFICEK